MSQSSWLVAGIIPGVIGGLFREFAIVVAAEGAFEKGGEPAFVEKAKPGAAARYGGVADKVAGWLWGIAFRRMISRSYSTVFIAAAMCETIPAVAWV